MKLSVFSLLALAVGVLSALAPQKAVIVTYPEDTPNSVVDKAMEAITEAGGIITHEYKLFKSGRQLLQSVSPLTMRTEASQQRRLPKSSNLYRLGVQSSTQLSRKIKWSRS
jgi:hypothetical protein